MIPSLEHACAFHGPQIGNIFDHAKFTIGALFRQAYIADFSGADIPADPAFPRGGGDDLHHVCKGRQQQGKATVRGITLKLMASKV